MHGDTRLKMGPPTGICKLLVVESECGCCPISAPNIRTLNQAVDKRTLLLLRSFAAALQAGAPLVIDHSERGSIKTSRARLPRAKPALAEAQQTRTH